MAISASRKITRMEKSLARCLAACREKRESCAGFTKQAGCQKKHAVPGMLGNGVGGVTGQVRGLGSAFDQAFLNECGLQFVDESRQGVDASHGGIVLRLGRVRARRRRDGDRRHSGLGRTRSLDDRSGAMKADFLAAVDPMS